MTEDQKEKIEKFLQKGHMFRSFDNFKINESQDDNENTYEIEGDA